MFFGVPAFLDLLGFGMPGDSILGGFLDHFFENVVFAKIVFLSLSLSLSLCLCTRPKISESGLVSSGDVTLGDAAPGLTWHAGASLPSRSHGYEACHRTSAGGVLTPRL